MTTYKILSIEKMKRDMNKSTEERIKTLVEEGEILSAQRLYFEKQNELRRGIIRL